MSALTARCIAYLYIIGLDGMVATVIISLHPMVLNRDEFYLQFDFVFTY